MNIFGVGGAELVLVLIIMLVVAGPQRMLRWAYIAGKYAAQLRVIWDRMIEVVQSEINEAGMDVELPREIPTRHNLDAWFREQTKDVTASLEDDMKHIQDKLDEAKSPQTVARHTADTADENESSHDETAPQPHMERHDENHAVSFGSWDSDTTSNNAGDADDFGAWTTPRHPGDMRAQDAESTESESDRA